MADSTYTSGTINFTGLGNGTDFNTLIEGLVDIERNRITRLENWKLSWETKNEQFQELNTEMLTLKTTLEGMNSLNEFMSKTVSSSNTNLLVATGNAEALESTHTIQINQLATNDILITASGASSLSASVVTSDTNFTFRYGGKSYTIENIAAGTSLESLVGIINNHPSSRGIIQASTIYDGSTYHLQLAGKGLGANNQLVISNTGGLIFGAGSFSETQNAQNAQIRVDGFPLSGAGWIERSSNTVDNIITGISLNLKEADPDSVISLTVTTDTEAIAENIGNFIEAVNMVRARIIALTEVDEEGEGSILTGNYGIDMVSQNLKNITASMGLGFTPWDEDTLTGDRFSALSQLGIFTDAEQGSPTYGLLTIDYEALDEALTEDPAAVVKLFAAEAMGETQSPDFRFNSLIQGTTKAGVYDIRIVSDGSRIVSATIDGVEAGIDGWEITGMEGGALGMAVRLNTTAAGTYTGQVSVKIGKAGEMIDELKELTKPFNEYTYEGGPLAVLQNNYNEIIDNIDDKIAYEETRIAKMEKNLRLKYARLDALLGQYELRQGQLDAALAQLE